MLRLKPLSGVEEEGSAIHLGLESALVKSASFPAPSLEQSSSRQLLRDAGFWRLGAELVLSDRWGPLGVCRVLESQVETHSLQ